MMSTTIPANPGFAVLVPQWSNINDTSPLEVNPVIAWIVPDCRGTAPMPVIVRGVIPHPLAVQHPDGRVYLPGEFRYAADQADVVKSVRKTLKAILDA